MLGKLDLLQKKKHTIPVEYLHTKHISLPIRGKKLQINVAKDVYIRK